MQTLRFDNAFVRDLSGDPDTGLRALELDDRLEMQQQLVAIERGAQIDQQRQAPRAVRIAFDIVPRVAGVDLLEPVEVDEHQGVVNRIYRRRRTHPCA